MDKLFGSLKDLLKIQYVVTDNNVFRLHYQVTVPILIAFSLLVTGRQYIGDPIDCISKDDVPEAVFETFCWVHSTFSVEHAWNKKVGVEIPYPGVDKYKHDDKKIYHAYYQWVCFVLFLQALLFYIPRYFWKMFEGGRVRAMVLNLNRPIISEENKHDNVNLLTNYVVASFGKGNNSYAIDYMIAELLNVVNVIGQMYLMDSFLGGSFSTYGADILKFSEWDQSVRYDPMIRVFPRLTKCTFHRYGSSGDVQLHDAMCILPINIINEKIYVFLWFWFVFLAVVSCVAVAYRVIMIVSQEARTRSLKSRASLVAEGDFKTILPKCGFGDWFVLHLLAKNLDSIHYRDFMKELALRL